jgi:hypothetical protein
MFQPATGLLCCGLKLLHLSLLQKCRMCQKKLQPFLLTDEISPKRIINNGEMKRLFRFFNRQNSEITEEKFPDFYTWFK